MQKVRAGIAWFSPEQWPEYRAIMADFEGDTYEQWLNHAQKMERQLKQRGVETVRVPIDLSDFSFWCARNKRPLDSSARADYAAGRL